MKLKNKPTGLPGKPFRKIFSCFVCNSKLDDSGLSLIRCQTAFSRITLGEKLQEVLGTKYLVLISHNDKLCWDCASFLNGIDRFEFKIDFMKEYLFEKIHAKYKRVEVSIKKKQEDEGGENTVGVEGINIPDDKPPSRSSGKRVHFEDEKDSFNSRDLAELKCKYCGKMCDDLDSLNTHIKKWHTALVSCSHCGVKFESHAKLRKHVGECHNQNAKELTCVSCGFCTTNTEVYCRHICNSSIVSLTCISCNKRYVDSNFRDKSVSTHKCKSCVEEEEEVQMLLANQRQQEDLIKEESLMTICEDMQGDMEDPIEAAGRAEEEEEGGGDDDGGRGGGAEADDGEITLQVEGDEVYLEGEEDEEDALEIADINSSQASPPQEEMGGLEPEFFHESEIHPELNDGNELPLKKAETQYSYLKCEGCGEHFNIRDLTQHSCFLRGESVEFVEVEGPPLVTCKACNAHFPDIESLRIHWDHTNHPKQVGTPAVEFNKIKDKYKKTEAVFKVVKQNFDIKAFIPGQNEETLRMSDNYKDMFVRVSDRKTDPIEDFIKRNGNSCGTCGNSFSSIKTLESHQKYDCLTCVTCKVSFYDNQLLKKHYLYTGHASKLRVSESFPSLNETSKSNLGFKCHLCDKTFVSRFLLGKHFQVHYKGTERGACQFCLTEFENKNDIQQHVLEVHGAHLYKCGFCERTFMSELFRDRHEAKHKNARPLVFCKLCDLKLPSQKSLLLHNETYHNGTTCRLCGKIIEDPIALRRHERRHYFDKKLECDLCKKRFRSKHLLLSHATTHSVDEIKFQCDICLLGFLSESALKEHKLSHIRKSKYKCSRCGLTFGSRAHYWMHSKTHDVAYPCTVCNRSFRDSSLLAIHRRKHWRVRPYQCPQCHRVFSVSSTLLRHLYIHNRQYPHRCGICKKGFLTRHTYLRHTETVHPVSEDSYPPRRSQLPSLPLNATDEDIFQAADTLIADDSIMFNDNEFSNKEEMEQSSSSDLITNEVVVETTELFDEILS